MSFYMSVETLAQLKGLPRTEVETRTRLQHSIQFVPLDKRGSLPVVRLSEDFTPENFHLWDGQPRKLRTPTTINGAITEAIIHQTVMEFEGDRQDEAWGNPLANPDISHIRGYSSHPIDKRTAFLHVFLPTPQELEQINDDDPAVIARREALVPPTVNPVKLYKDFLKEIEGGYNEETGEYIPPSQLFFITAEGVRENLNKRLARGEKLLKAHFETVLDILVEEWDARDGISKQIGKERTQEPKAEPLAIDSQYSDYWPKGANGEPIEGHIVFDTLALPSIQDAEFPGKALEELAGRILNRKGEVVTDGLEGDDAKIAAKVAEFRETTARGHEDRKAKLVDDEVAREIRLAEEHLKAKVALLRSALTK